MLPLSEMENGTPVHTHHALILSTMELAERVGRRYAKSWKRHPDECVAEAYYQLVELFTNYKHLYDHENGGPKAVVMFVRRGIKDYFREHRVRPLGIDYDKATLTTDEEMLDYLSDVMRNDDDAHSVFRFIRDGVDIHDILVVEPRLRKAITRVWRQVIGRLGRLDANQVQRKRIENGCDSRERCGDGYPIELGSESDQPQDSFATGYEGKTGSSREDD